jgi:hypothetical protein
MKSKTTIFGVIISVLILAACASVDVTKTSKGFLSPTDANAVEILKTVPTTPFEELGTVTVTGFSADEVAKMHNAVRAKSAALGANAVVLTQEGIVPGMFSSTRWATGVAIAYKK